MKKILITIVLLCGFIFIKAQTTSDTSKIILKSDKMIYNESTPISLSSSFEITTQKINWYSEFPKTKDFESLGVKGKSLTYLVSKSNIGQDSNEYFAKDDKSGNLVKITFDKIKSIVIIQDLSKSNAKVSFPLIIKN